MMRMLLVRGMLSGLVAGLLALVFARVFGEPSVDGAINFESAEHAGHVGHGHAGVAEPELVSRAVQSTVGLASGVLVYAIAFGGLFALAFAVVYGRVGALTPRATSVVLAACGFGSAFVVPFLKYPANPPAVGNAETIGQRTALYFGMVALSLVLAVAATWFGRRLAPRLGAWTATLAAIGAFLVAVGTVQFLLPTIDEIPDGFPAALLWNFRLSSLGTELVMWTAMGLLFGELVQRRLGRRPDGAVAPGDRHLARL